MAQPAIEDRETEQYRRAAALERIQRLRARVSARNQDLTLEQAEEIAEELSQAAIRSLAERGEVVIERTGP